MIYYYGLLPAAGVLLSLGENAFPDEGDGESRLMRQVGRVPGLPGTLPLSPVVFLVAFTLQASLQEAGDAVHAGDVFPDVGEESRVPRADRPLAEVLDAQIRPDLLVELPQVEGEGIRHRHVAGTLLSLDRDVATERVGHFGH